MTICKFTLSFVIIQFYLVYFIVGITPVLTSRSSFICLLCHFEKKQKKKSPQHWGFIYFWPLSLWHYIFSRFILYTFCPSPQSAISPRSPDSFFQRVLLKPSSGHRCAHSYWNVFAFRTFRMTQKENLSCDFYPLVWDKIISRLEQFQSTEELSHSGFLSPQGSLSCSAESIGSRIAILLLLFTLGTRRLGKAGSPYIPGSSCFFQVHCCP